MNWYLTVLKKYAVFSGRARREEYWYFVLFNTIIYIFLFALIEIFIRNVLAAVVSMPIVGLVYMLATYIPSLAVLVRRLHDTGRSGWWFFIVLIPLIGTIVLLVFLCQDSEPGQNQYGANPKEETA